MLDGMLVSATLIEMHVPASPIVPLPVSPGCTVPDANELIGAGSELIIVPDITWAQGGSSWTGRSAVAGPYFIPIPAGTRIAARGASPAGSPFDVGVILTAMYQ